MDTYDLNLKTKEELILIVEELLQCMTYDDRVNFVSSKISIKAGLRLLGETDGEDFLNQIDQFCSICHSHYYSTYFQSIAYENESGYVDFGEDRENESEIEWVNTFNYFFKVALMYAKIGDADTAFHALIKLIECLYSGTQDVRMFDMENPFQMLNPKWQQVYDTLFSTMKQTMKDSRQLSLKAIDMWIKTNFESTEAVLVYINDLPNIESAIRLNIEEYEYHWTIQHKLYLLLKDFYKAAGSTFDEVDLVKKLVRFNTNFYVDLATSYMSQHKWKDALDTLLSVKSHLVNPSLSEEANSKLIQCYNQLCMYNDAFDISKASFLQHQTYAHYLKTRILATKANVLQNFLADVQPLLTFSDDRNRNMNLLRICSYEGYCDKMYHLAYHSKGVYGNDYRNYTLKSLIYRVLFSKSLQQTNLLLYIHFIKEEAPLGITDMRKFALTQEVQDQLLLDAIELLKLMIQYQIDGHKRHTYEQAAYECLLMKEIYEYLGMSDQFDTYYSQLFKVNSRRPLLKEALRKHVGYPG